MEDMMARSVTYARLNSRTSRATLKRGRQAHWETLSGTTHLGYQRQKKAASGRWILRRYLGGGNKYRITPLGIADDANDANGTNILSYDQAAAKARAMVGSASGGKIERLTVRKAMELYVENKLTEGKSLEGVLSRGNAHILPPLGDLVVSELNSDTLKRWLSNMASSPAMVRPKAGKVQYRKDADDESKSNEAKSEEAIRRRRASANRVLTILKAILNYAYDEGHISNRDAWGRKLKPFRDVEVARIRYLTIAEAKRLVNVCDSDFRLLVRAALETGARYGELTRLEVVDFNPDVGTLAIRKSKTGKARQIVLTEEGAAFFKSVCAGRSGSERMFTKAQGTKANGVPWKTSDQARPMKAANEIAKLTPTISFHGLRHTWASHSVMNGVPLMVVARNLGHVDTTMVEKHYGHLAPSYVVDAIRAGAPKFGFKADKKVVTLR
jgi:integrase